MSDGRVKLGQRGEELAVAELTRQDYEIVTHNWHCQAGEVDVVACRGEVCGTFLRYARDAGGNLAHPRNH